MAITLYHNPRCSKSRQARALLEARGVKTTLRHYLEDPLHEEELRDLMSRLDADGERLVRTGEPEWKMVEENNLQDQEQVIRAILAHPKLLERPIADNGVRAVIGRPPEDVLVLLPTDH